jgi:dephospho-CoA kinase
MSNAEALRDLERILDPAVSRAIAQRVEDTTARLVVLDAIRLIESGLADRCDTIWVVVCDPNLQLQRLQASRGLTREQAALRVAAQRPADEKLRHANAVIANDSSPDDLRRQIDAAFDQTVRPALRV